MHTELHSGIHYFLLIFYILFFFSKITFFEKNIRNTIKMSNSLDPDQPRHFVGPDLGTNFLLRSSADDTGKQRMGKVNCNEGIFHKRIN